MQRKEIQPKERQPRNSSIELLRIAAMIFIVLSHACYHSQFAITEVPFSFNKLIVQWGVLGNLGVDIYVLISGYFLCKKKSTRRSMTRLLVQVWFYSFVLFLICKVGLRYPYSLQGYCKVLFPTVFQEYWFFTAYFVLVFLCPYINLLLEKTERKQLERLIGVLLVFWVVVPTFTRQSMYGESLEQLMLFYVIGAYFRLHSECVPCNKTAILAVTGCSFLLLFASTFVLDFLGQYFSFFQNRGIQFYARTSVLVVACAIGMFLFAVNCPAFSNNRINAISGCTFGVYLIHDNPAVRDILWGRVFKLADSLSAPFLVGKIIASVVIVFCVCIAIEYMRLRFLGKYFDRVSMRLENLIIEAGRWIQKDRTRSKNKDAAE